MAIFKVTGYYWPINAFLSCDKIALLKIVSIFVILCLCINKSSTFKKAWQSVLKIAKPSVVLYLRNLFWKLLVIFDICIPLSVITR